MAQVLSLESLLADSQDRSCQAIATAEDLADRIFLSAFARFASYFLRTLRRLLGDSLMLPASLSKLEDCLFCQNEDACRYVYAFVLYNFVPLTQPSPPSAGCPCCQSPR
ncbi:hypothetical protein EON64_01000 [archaeon]|nr:MAG: hypothetical protein EON64_01000 [archaeon]